MPIRAFNSNGISIGSSVFAQMTAECLYFTLRITPFHGGIWTPIQYMVPWAHLTLQSKWHLDQFSHFCRAQQCDRQTDQQTTSTYIVLQCSLIITSGQSNLTTCRIAAAHGRFSDIRQLAPLCTSLNTCILGPTQVHNQNSISISSAIFAQIMTVSLGMPMHVLSTTNCPLAWGDLDLHLTHGSLGPPEPISKTASRSVQPFLQGCLTWTVQSYPPGCANVYTAPSHNTWFLGHLDQFSHFCTADNRDRDRQTDRQTN